MLNWSRIQDIFILNRIIRHFNFYNIENFNNCINFNASP